MKSVETTSVTILNPTNFWGIFQLARGRVNELVWNKDRLNKAGLDWTELGIECIKTRQTKHIPAKFDNSTVDPLFSCFIFVGSCSALDCVWS